MTEQSYNRQLELYIYKKLSDAGYKCCDGIDTLFGQYGRLYTNPQAYQNYCHVAYIIRLKYKRKYGVQIRGNKLITKEQFDVLVEYVDWIFNDFLNEKEVQNDRAD